MSKKFIATLNDWVPDAWEIEELRKRQKEIHQRPRPYLEVPMIDYEPLEEVLEEADERGGTVIIIDI